MYLYEESDDADLIMISVCAMLFILLMIAFDDQIMWFIEWVVSLMDSIMI